MEDPHLKFRKSLVPLTSDTDVTKTKNKKAAACSMLPFRSSFYNPSVTDKWMPAQKLGEQSVEILCELGYTEEQIDDLRKRKVVWPYL